MKGVFVMDLKLLVLFLGDAKDDYLEVLEAQASEEDFDPKFMFDLNQLQRIRKDLGSLIEELKNRM
jgi:hypothetical protein